MEVAKFDKFVQLLDLRDMAVRQWNVEIEEGTTFFGMNTA